MMAPECPVYSSKCRIIMVCFVATKAKAKQQENHTRVLQNKHSQSQQNSSIRKKNKQTKQFRILEIGT